MGSDEAEGKPRRRRRMGGALFAGIDNPMRYDLAAFRALHGRLTRRHEEFESLSELYAVTDEVLGFYLECLRLADHRPEEEIRGGTFLYAFIGLSCKVISHAESIRALVNIGRYGDAVALTRVMISDMTMVTYLSIYPEDCADWMELSTVREPRMTRKGRYGELLAKFGDGELRRKIESGGLSPVSAEGYGAYSEALHASAWGVQFYARVEPHPRAGQTTIYYAPLYDPWVALRRVTVMTSSLVEPIANFMWWCEKSGVTWHKEYLVRWTAIRNNAIRMCEAGMAAAQGAFEEFYQSRAEDSGSS